MAVVDIYRPNDIVWCGTPVAYRTLEHLPGALRAPIGTASDVGGIRVDERRDPSDSQDEGLWGPAAEDLLARFAAAFDALLVPILTILDRLDAYIDVGVAPPSFLRWMAGWLGLPPIAALDLAGGSSDEPELDESYEARLDESESERKVREAQRQVREAERQVREAERAVRLRRLRNVLVEAGRLLDGVGHTADNGPQIQDVVSRTAVPRIGRGTLGGLAHALEILLNQPVHVGQGSDRKATGAIWDSGGARLASNWKSTVATDPPGESVPRVYVQLPRAPNEVLAVLRFAVPAHVEICICPPVENDE